VGGGARGVTKGGAARAAVLHPIQGEHRWPSALAVAVAVLLQLLLPAPMVPQGRYLLPMLELALLVALVVANPFRMHRESRALRVAGLGLTALVGLSNGWSALLLAARILDGGYPAGPAALLATGGAIWLTNVLAFALLYWELDGGGPGARVTGAAAPDLAFAQTQNPELATADWRPEFVDYLFVAFTAGTSFGPTDVTVLSRRLKVAMMTQAAVALVVVVLVVARAVNVLG
jgi:Protein of unknown function (DUF1345)